MNQMDRTCLIVTSLLAGSLAWAQGTTKTEKLKAEPTSTSTTSREASSGMASGRRVQQSPKAPGARVNQFGHASGKQMVSTIPPTPTTDINPANARVLASSHATESATGKHIAGVKYEDRTVASGLASSDDANKIAIDEPGSQRATAATAKPSAPSR